MSLPGFSVRQSVLVNALFIICLLGGVVAFERIAVDFFPDISFNQTIIDTLWAGASAEEVERLVTTKIEEELKEVDGVKEIHSFSRANQSEISVEWDETLSEAEYEFALADLRAAVERVGDLPLDAEEPLLRELSVSEVYAVIQVVVLDAGGVGEMALLDVARDIETRIEDLPGVRKATIRGEHDREVRVLVDPDTAAHYDLTLLDVADRIRRENLNLPAGTFTNPTGESTLRATGDYGSVDEILETVVRENTNGTFVRLRDVATLEEGVEKRRFYGRYNGKPALIIGVAKESDAHITHVAEHTRELVQRQRASLPQGLELYTTWDTSSWVETRMAVLRDNLLTGVFLVMAILWFTIGFRNALLTIIAIPFSFLTAFLLFPVLDITINSISLVGMLLVSGMLVDDAIIVLENIYRRIEEGEPLRQAVVLGTDEVMWPVIAAVSTTCAAFVPLLLIGGTAGEFMSILPKTVIVCLVASLVECLVILPAHYYDWGSRRVPGARPPRSGRVGRALDAFEALHGSVDVGIDRLRSVYLRALDSVLHHRASFACLALGLFVFAIAGATHLPVALFGSEYNNFFITLETPSDWGLDQTDGVFRGVEQTVDGLLGDTLIDYSTYVGMSMSGDRDPVMSPNMAMAYAMIVEREEYVLEPEKAIRQVQERLDVYREANPLRVVDLRAVPPRNGPPIGKPVAVRLQGDDYDLSKAIAGEMKSYLATLPGVFNIEDNLREGPREVRLVVQEERAAHHGLAFEDVARAFRAANDGLVASTFRARDDKDEVDIRVLPELGFRRDLRDILDARVRTPAGYRVELSDVVDIELDRGYLSLAHYEGQRAVTVYADVDQDQATSVSVNQALAARFADLPMRFPEVEVIYGGEFQGTAEAFADMRAVLPLALILIYMILAAQFRSYLQPVVVATAIPFAIIGVISGVAIMGYAISFMLLYATIGLMGVVVNDSLVMVDFINRARAEGTPLHEAVRQTGAKRLRPILLTTFTTVFALLPMALGLAGGSKSYGPFAAAITFGLVVSMFGTLFIVPLSYTSLVVWQERLGRLRASRLRGRPSSVPDPDPAGR